jgi:hypothetical protein
VLASQDGFCNMELYDISFKLLDKYEKCRKELSCTNEESKIVIEPIFAKPQLLGEFL